MKGFRLSSAAGSIPRSTPDSYLAIHVRGKLTPGEESRQKFYAATLQNARNSILEPGVSRFDLLRGVEDPSDFLLVEVYKDENSAPAAHKETAHYQQWREAVEPLMAQPRAASKYHTLFPPLQPLSSSWDTLETSSDVDLLTHQQTKPWDAELYSVTRSDHIPQKRQQGGMLAVAVDVQVVPGQEEAFIAHTLDNCRCSIREPGVHRFDLLRSASDSSNFVLVEIYSSAEAPVRHKDTAHYKRWAAAVADMMARPRAASKYATLFPAPLFFHKVPHLVYPGEGQQFLDQLLADADAPGGDKGTPAVGGVARGGGESAWDGRRGLESAAPQLFGFVGPKILMGRGIATDAIQSACKSLQARRPLLVTGSTGLRRHEALLASIAAVLPEEEDGGYDVQQHCVQIQGEPTVEDALRLVQVASEHGCDSVIAVGGGSAVDAGKAAAALIPNLRLSGSDIFDYLEVIGKGLPLSETPLPFIAVPTTSGTGSEVTKNAVLKSDAHGLKVSIRHDKMLPDAAVIDPLLTLSCPPSVTAHVGMDALCQLIEPYICNVPNPFVDALCREGIIRAARSLRSAVADGQRDVRAREDMCVAAVMGGLCLANARLGTVHGFAAVLGGRYERAPHGAICAALLPHVFERNALALQEIVTTGTSSSCNGDSGGGGEGGGGGSLLEDSARMDALVKLSRMQEVSRWLTGNPAAGVAEGVAWLHALLRDINIPALADVCGIVAGSSMGAEEAEEVVQAVTRSSSNRGNPVPLSTEALKEVLFKAL